MEFERSIPRKAWTCYFDGNEEEKIKKLERLFPTVQFSLGESKKLIICKTGQTSLDNKVKNVVLEMGGIKA